MYSTIVFFCVCRFYRSSQPGLCESSRQQCLLRVDRCVFFWLHHPEMVAETMSSLMMFDGLSFWFQFSVIVLLVQHGIPYFQTNLKGFFGHCLFSDIPLWSNLMCWLRQETSRRSPGHLSAGLVQSPVGCNAPFDTALIDRFLHGVVIVMGYNMYWLL